MFMSNFELISSIFISIAVVITGIHVCRSMAHSFKALDLKYQKREIQNRSTNCIYLDSNFNIDQLKLLSDRISGYIKTNFMLENFVSFTVDQANVCLEITFEDFNNASTFEDTRKGIVVFRHEFLCYDDDIDDRIEMVWELTHLKNFEQLSDGVTEEEDDKWYDFMILFVPKICEYVNTL